MDAGRSKKKRSELELLLGNGDAGAQAAFSPRLPALSISSPVMPEAAAESDEQLARRLHEELNGTRVTRRGSKAVTEDVMPLSPTARGGLASPHGHRAKLDTPKAPGAGGRASLPTLPSVPGLALAADAGGTVADAADTGAGALGGGSAGDGGGEAVKRKRNNVPARELHLLLQQASSTSGRAEAALSPTRSARGALTGSRAEPPTTHMPNHGPAGDDSHLPPPLPRRDSDRAHGTARLTAGQPSASSGSAPVAPPPPPALPPPPPPLPPKLKQRYLAAGACPPPAASASASSDAKERADAQLRRASCATTATPTAVTPNNILGAARNSLLSGQSLEGCSQQSHSHPIPHDLDAPAPAPSAVAEGAAAGAPLASQAATGSRAAAATGASVGGCSSTDETENDNENGCGAAVAGAGAGGPSATSPKASLPPHLPSTTQDQNQQQQAEEPQQQQHRQRQQAAAQQAQPKQGHGQQAALKVPKLPMIRAGRGWYRGRLMRESPDGQRVLVDVPGAPNPGSHQQQHFWLPTVSDRIWRGSYKGKDWKYLGDGAWEPKPGAFKRGKLGSSSNGLQLPLPSWATGGAGPVDAQPASGPCPRAKRERGWSGIDETSEQEDAEAQEEQPRTAPQADGPGGRPQRSQRRTSPAASGPPADQPSAGPNSGAAGGGKGLDVAVAAAEVDDDDADAAAGGPAPAEVAGSGSAPSTEEEEEEQQEEEKEGGKAENIDEMTAAEHAPVVEAAGEPAEAPEAAAAGAPLQPQEGAGEDADGGAAGGSGNACAADAAKAELEDGNGAAGGDEGSDGGIWHPGLPFPRTRAPRRARQRQQLLRSPLDGLQLPTQSHNPYTLHHGLSGDESGGEGDAAAGSDGEPGGRRGSDANGDGTGLPSRRRAAARAAAVAAAAARAEAEAEEEEQEEILMGRRPPRRDRYHPHLPHSGGGGGKRQHHASQHHRSRSGAKGDDYMYGDSSGGMDDPYTGEAAHVRHRNSRGNSQPAAECGSGGSQAWEAAQWQQAVAGHANGGGCAAAGGGHGPMQQRSRRKGKPNRSRMDGEGDAWCYREDDWRADAAGGAWARMPQVLRQLYYAAVPAAAPEGGAQQQQQQQRQQVEGDDVADAKPGHHLHRQSGGGYYHGAQAPPNKRPRVYDEEQVVFPDDLEVEEVDDHEQDTDYQPPYGGPGSRRNSTFGGRRCSGSGAAAVGAAKRLRTGDPSLGLYCDLAPMTLTMAMAVDGSHGAPPQRRRILVSCGPLGWPGAGGREEGLGTATARGGIPAGLAGLLEAALGHDVDGDNDLLRTEDVKRELQHFPDGAGRSVGAGGVGAAAGQHHPLGPADSHAAHVALSDSSANHSAGEDPRGVAGVMVDASGAGGCGGSDPSATPLLRPQHPCGTALAAFAAAATGVGSGSPPPSALQLRPGTPTRARRTGRPPSAVLGAGAPLPKLPALSSSASLRLQMAATAGSSAAAAAAAAALAADGSAAAALEADGASQGAFGAVGGSGGQDPLAQPLESSPPRPEALARGVCSLERSDAGPCAGEQAAEPGTSSSFNLWQAASGAGGSTYMTLQPEAAAGGAEGSGGVQCAQAHADARAPSGFVSPSPVLASASSAGVATATMKSIGSDRGSGCCVMDAIGALLGDNQPAMQQLVMRAQLELDSIGLVVSPQQAAVQDEQLLLQQQLLAGRGGGRCDAMRRSGSLSGVPYSSYCGEAPSAPDAFITALPSVEVVVNLFSARTPFGGAQQALADLVGGAAALPLFR